MHTNFKTHTWGCTVCTYTQDNIDPSVQADVDKHFNAANNYKGFDVQLNECPSCVLKGIRGSQMAKVTIVGKKAEMNANDKTTKSETKTLLEAQEPLSSVVGKGEPTLETDEELNERAEDHASHLKAEAKADKKQSILDAGKVLVKRSIEIPEGVKERKERIDEHVEGIETLTDTQIAKKKAEFED